MLPKKYTSWLTINRACNLRCEWCYAKSLHFTSRENMSPEALEKSLIFLRSMPLSDVILIGGEPTVHPGFIDIAGAVSGGGFNTYVISNSIRFKDDKFLEQTIRAGVKGVTTSLKAANREDYRKYTGSDKFDDVIRAIDNLNRADIYHKISVTICQGLFKTFDQLIELVTAMGTVELAFDMERPIIVGGVPVAPEELDPKEMADFFESIYPKLEQSGLNYTLKISIPFCLFSQGFIEKLVEKNRIISGCQIFGGSGLIIDPNGRLLPCNHFCDHPLGTIGTDFINFESFVDFRERPDVSGFYDTMANYPDEKCAACSDWKFCGGGCRMHWLLMGADRLLPINQKGGDQIVRARITQASL